MDIVIIEDEYLLAEELEEKLLSLMPEIKILARLESVKESIEWFKVNTCDLIFSDIHLSDGIVFSIFDEVKISIPIIFLTAYDHYAIKAFDLNSISYLLKPIKHEDLKKSLNKFKESLYSSSLDFSVLKDLVNIKKTGYKKRLILSLGKVFKPVLVEDIAYFMADGKYLFAIVKTGERYFCNFTLLRLEGELNPNNFFRISRKFFVSYSAVKELLPYSKSRLKLKLFPETDEEVIISTSRAKEFKTWLEN
jgi:DNA-binding LytR/AlgR family response regulator